MSRTVVVRYQTRADAGRDNERLVQEVFAQLADADSGSMRYLAFRLADGVTLVIPRNRVRNYAPTKSGRFISLARQIPR